MWKLGWRIWEWGGQDRWKVGVIRVSMALLEYRLRPEGSGWRHVSTWREGADDGDFDSACVEALGDVGGDDDDEDGREGGDVLVALIAHVGHAPRGRRKDTFQELLEVPVTQMLAFMRVMVIGRSRLAGRGAGRKAEEFLHTYMKRKARPPSRCVILRVTRHRAQEVGAGT